MRERGSVAEVDATYQRIVELERTGISRQTAFAKIGEREGLNLAAVSARYYAARKRLNPDTESKVARPTRMPKVNGVEVDAALLLETAAAMILEASTVIARLESDAARWREVRAMARNADES